MDPLSITTGVVTLLGASAATLRLFKRIGNLKNGPALIQSLNNEISDLHLAAMNINDYIKRARARKPQLTTTYAKLLDRCTEILEESKHRVQEVEALIHYRVLKPGREAEFEINRLHFLQERSRLVQLQTELRDSRQRISNLFAYLGIKEYSDTEVLLKDIRFNGSRLGEDVLKALQMLESGQGRLEDKLGQVLNVQVPDQISKNGAIQSLAGFAVKGVQVSVTQGHRIPGRGCHACSKRKRTSICWRTCLGILFVGYNPGFVNSQCEQNCFVTSESNLSLTYYFPTTFVNRAISLCAQHVGNLDLKFSISISQCLPPGDTTWLLICLADIEGLQELLSTGQLSIKARLTNGLGLLAVSLIVGSIEPVEFLARIQNTSCLKTVEPRMAHKVAWNMILTNSRGPEWNRRVKPFFPTTDLDDLYGFSSLHKAVLGLEDYQAESTISAANGQIDVIDNCGRTPLSWACQCGNSQLAEELLLRGANCNLPDERGFPPIHYATLASSDCTELLLRAGAGAATEYTNNDISPIVGAIGSVLPEDEVVKIIDMLMKAGCDVNATSIWTHRLTSLNLAARCKRTVLFRWLLLHGAELGKYDDFGFNELCWAALGNSHEIPELLIHRRQDHTRQIEHIGSFLHLVARYADSKTVQLLESGRLRSRDINVKNKGNLTPLQIAQKRCGVGLEWRKAFMGFLSSIDKDSSLRRNSTVPRTNNDTVGSGRDLGENDVDNTSDEVFEDAVEFQEDSQPGGLSGY